MWGWWRRRKAREQQAVRDADNLMALFGDGAYWAALERARHEEENDRDPRHWLRVRREIGRRVGKESGLDTATRYISNR